MKEKVEEMGECQGARPGLIELTAIRRVTRKGLKRLASLLLEGMRKCFIVDQQRETLPATFTHHNLITQKTAGALGLTS